MQIEKEKSNEKNSLKQGQNQSWLLQVNNSAIISHDLL